MELFPHFPQFLCLFLSFIIFGYKIANKKSRCIKLTAPEPSGALPFVGHLHHLHGREPVARILGKMADHYGSIFSLRLGSQRAMVVSSWQMVKECFSTNDRNFATRPAMAVGKYMGYDNAVFALAPYGPYWREMRKMVVLELLTSQRLEKLKNVRNSEVRYLTNDLYSLTLKNIDSQKRVVNMTNWFEHVTFNIIVRMLAGKRFSSGSSDRGNNEDIQVKEAIKKGLYLSGVFVVSDVIPCLEWMDIGGHVKAMKQAAKELDAVFGRWVDEHVEKRNKCDSDTESDFMDVMLSSLSEDAELFGHGRETIIKATTLILILTGSESTAETLTWALSLLLNHPRILKVAHQELDTHVGRNKWVEESDIKNLTYLQAIVKETLRMYPPGPLAGPHQAIEDCNIKGYHVTKGTRLIVNIWKLHRDPQVWSNPDEFRPERFLQEHSNINYQGQNFEYIPFSSGRRMCPATSFALEVIYLTLARILQGFDLSTPMGMPVDMSEGLGIALPKVKPLEVIINPRLSRELY